MIAEKGRRESLRKTSAFLAVHERQKRELARVGKRLGIGGSAKVQP